VRPKPVESSPLYWLRPAG